VDLPAADIRHRKPAGSTHADLQRHRCAADCLLLLVAEPLFSRDGELFALAISIYAVTRFLIEILRCDEAPISGTGMTVSQNISLALLILVVGCGTTFFRRPKGKAFSTLRIENAA